MEQISDIQTGVMENRAIIMATAWRWIFQVNI